MVLPFVVTIGGCGLIADFDPLELRRTRADAGGLDGALRDASQSDASSDGATIDEPVADASASIDARSGDAARADAGDASADATRDALFDVPDVRLDAPRFDLGVDSFDAASTDATIDVAVDAGVGLWDATIDTAFPPSLPTRFWPPNGTEIDPNVPVPLSIAWFSAADLEIEIQFQPVDASCLGGYRTCPFATLLGVVPASAAREADFSGSEFAARFPAPGHYAWRVCPRPSGVVGGPCSTPRYFVVGRTRTDLDNNGHGSVIYRASGTREINAFDPVGGSISDVHTTTGSVVESELIVGDVTGDELPDILIGRPFDEIASVEFSGSIARERYWYVGDFNADAIPDVGYRVGSELGVAFGARPTAAPLAVSRPFVTTAGLDTISPIGDFDGDGVIDVALSGPTTRTVALVLGGTTSALAPVVALDIGYVPVAIIALDDVDRPRDGYGDFATVGDSLGEIVIDVFHGPSLTRGPESGIVSGTVGCTSAPTTAPFAIGGFDADSNGTIDVLVGSRAGSQVFLWSSSRLLAVCISTQNDITSLVPVGRGIDVTTFGIAQTFVATHRGGGTKRLMALGVPATLTTPIPSDAVVASAF